MSKKHRHNTHEANGDMKDPNSLGKVFSAVTFSIAVQPTNVQENLCDDLKGKGADPNKVRSEKANDGVNTLFFKLVIRFPI